MYDIDLKNDIAPNSDFDLRINVGTIGTGNARNIKIVQTMKVLALWEVILYWWTGCLQETTLK